MKTEQKCTKKVWKGMLWSVSKRTPCGRPAKWICMGEPRCGIHAKSFLPSDKTQIDEKKSGDAQHEKEA